MTMHAYRRAVALPGIAVGVVPLAVGLIAGSIDLTAFGALFLGGAGGDALILWHTRAIAATTMVQDSEMALGCEIVPA